ncbi:MAG: nuclear transport factor 2 family protein [Gemmatimonadota bacterium]|nr:nuclear transport factor 2 family protein [Gemmatimonadota bacterium]
MPAKTTKPDGPSKVVRAFIDRINHADVDALASLMTTEHVFIDALGHHFTGRDAVRTGWESYFVWFPDYHIEIDEVISRGVSVAAFGTAKGTFAGELREHIERTFESPAAWRATVQSGRIAVWRVYCDVSAQQRILAASR